MINNKSIGRKLKELRISRDLKQSELADLVGLSRPAISNIESGKRSLTLSTLKRFCEVYGIDISYFGIDTSSYDEATDLTRENKRTLWRNVLESVHVSPDGIEVFFK